jgi:glycosyltransferase involved in cell wall biosynthesis
MHIGFVTPEYPTTKKPEGGLGTYIQKTSHELAQRGNQVTVFILAEKECIQNDDGVELRYITNFKLHWRLKRNPTLAAWLALFEQWINAIRTKKAVMLQHNNHPFHIVQVPNYKTPGLALCNNHSFPIVCRCSSYAPLHRSAKGYQRHFSDSIADWFEYIQIHNADKSFCPSEFLSRIFRRFESLDIEVIRTPLGQTEIINDDDVINYESLKNKKYLLYFGTLNLLKGVDLISQAIPEIFEANKDVSVVFVGPDHDMPGYKSMVNYIQENNSTYLNRIFYFSPLPKNKLFEIVKHAYGVILPSRIDNLPNTCLEAQQLGKIVIGTYDSSLEEMIDDGVTGFLAKNGDVESLKTVIQKILDMKAPEIDWMKHNIAQKINDIQNEDRISQLLEYYKRIIKTYDESR